MKRQENKIKKKKIGRASFCINQSCASSGLLDSIKPPPSTRSVDLCAGGTTCRHHRFQVHLVVLGSWSVATQGREREVTKWLPWSVHCPLRSIRKRWSPSQHIPLCKSSSPRERGWGEWNRRGDFYLMKFPPPISLLYLLVRWSACSVSLDRTPNSPLR